MPITSPATFLKQKMRSTPDGNFLISLNPKYEPIPINIDRHSKGNKFPLFLSMLADLDHSFIIPPVLYLKE